MKSTPAPISDPPQALQVFDAASGVTVMASIDGFAGVRAVFGRVAIFLPDGRVALYTGEARSPSDLGRDGPVFRRDGDGCQMSFHGSVLVTPNGDGYTDLEYALGQANLQSARIELSYQPSVAALAGRDLQAPRPNALRHNTSALSTPPAFGRVRGTVDIAGEKIDVDCVGFSAAREWGAWRRAGRSAWSARICLEDGAATILRSVRGARTEAEPHSVRVELGGDGYAPRLLSIALPHRTVLVRPITTMSIARPVGPRRRARVTFGPADIEVDGSAVRGTGIFEYARLIDR